MGRAAGGAARVSALVSSHANAALYCSCLFDVCVRGDGELFQIASHWMSVKLQPVRAFPHHVLAEAAGGGGDLKLAPRPPDDFPSFHLKLQPTLSAQIFSSLTWHIFSLRFSSLSGLPNISPGFLSVLTNDNLVGSFLKTVSQEAKSETCMTKNNYKREIKFIRKTTQSDK